MGGAGGTEAPVGVTPAGHGGPILFSRVRPFGCFDIIDFRGLIMFVLVRLNRFFVLFVLNALFLGVMLFLYALLMPVLGFHR